MKNKLSYYLKESFRSMRRNLVMTFSTVITVAITLFIVGAFMLAISILNDGIQQQANNTQLVVFDKSNTQYSSEQISTIQSQIKSINGVVKLDFISKEDGLKQYEEKYGKDKILSKGNPLPDRYDITVESADKLTTVKGEIEKIKGVDKVTYSQELVNVLNKTMNQLRIVGIIVILILFLSTVLLISTTIRLSVHSKRNEIMVMKYVGSSEGFIQGPFIITGIVYGILGAIVASFTLFVIFQLVISNWLNNIKIFNLNINSSLALIVALVLILAGGIIGALGSYICVRKYVRV